MLLVDMVAFANVPFRRPSSLALEKPAAEHAMNIKTSFQSFARICRHKLRNNLKKITIAVTNARQRS